MKCRARSPTTKAASLGPRHPEAYTHNPKQSTAIPKAQILSPKFTQSCMTLSTLYLGNIGALNIKSLYTSTYVSLSLSPHSLLTPRKTYPQRPRTFQVSRRQEQCTSLPDGIGFCVKGVGFRLWTEGGREREEGQVQACELEPYKKHLLHERHAYHPRSFLVLGIRESNLCINPYTLLPINRNEALNFKP